MGRKKFPSDKEVKQEVLKWMKEMVGMFYKKSIKKVVPRLQPALNGKVTTWKKNNIYTYKILPFFQKFSTLTF